MYTKLPDGIVISEDEHDVEMSDVLLKFSLRIFRIKNYGFRRKRKV